MAHILHLTKGRARGGKAQWRRSKTSFSNRLAAARAQAWHRWRGTTAQQQKSCGPSGQKTFGSPWSLRTEHRLVDAATCAHAFTSDPCAHGSVAACTPRSWCARFGHGAHATITTCSSRSLCERCGTAGTVTARAAKRVAKRPQARAAEGGSSVAGKAARGDGDFVRASGRFTSGRAVTAKRGDDARATGPAIQRGATIHGGSGGHGRRSSRSRRRSRLSRR